MSMNLWKTDFVIVKYVFSFRNKVIIIIIIDIIIIVELLVGEKSSKAQCWLETFYNTGHSAGLVYSYLLFK